MDDRAIAATLVGAVIGGMAGYLFFTDRGRELRRQIEPALDDIARELNSFRGTVQRAAGVASEGWKLLNDTLGDGGHQPPRYPRITSNITFLRREMAGELGTTNLILGIMAAVSVLEALAIIGLGHCGLHGLPARDGSGQRARDAADRAGDGARERDSRRSESRDGEGQRRNRTRRPGDPPHDRSRRRHGGSRAVERASQKTSRVVGFVRGLRVAMETMLNSRAA